MVYYGKTLQFSDFIKKMKALNINSVDVVGTVKIDGTNGGIGLEIKTGKVYAVSKHRHLTIENDNHRFAAYVAKHEEQFKYHLKRVLAYMQEVDEELCSALTDVVIYGEWCGKKIRNGDSSLTDLGINIFVPFQIKFINASNPEDVFGFVDHSLLGTLTDPDCHMFSIKEFKTFPLTIDVNNPEAAIAEMNALASEFAKQCPVATYFSVKGQGEGLVYTIENTEHRFKIRNEIKKGNRRPKTIEAEAPELAEAIKEFIERYINEDRLSQGVQVMKENNVPIDVAHTSDYINWVANDAIEEEREAIIKNDIDVRKLRKVILNKAREYYFANPLN